MCQGLRGIISIVQKEQPWLLETDNKKLFTYCELHQPSLPASHIISPDGPHHHPIITWMAEGSDQQTVINKVLDVLCFPLNLLIHLLLQHWEKVVSVPGSRSSQGS